jgi:hypothetical protein
VAGLAPAIYARLTLTAFFWSAAPPPSRIGRVSCRWTLDTSYGIVSRQHTCENCWHEGQLLSEPDTQHGPAANVQFRGNRRRRNRRLGVSNKRQSHVCSPWDQAATGIDRYTPTLVVPVHRRRLSR